MKKNLLILFAMFVSFSSISQETPNKKLKFKSISTGFGICAGELNDGGLNLSLDASTIINKNLISASVSFGGEIELNIMGSNRNQRDYKEFDLLYGREFQIFKFLKIEAHTGFGIFNELYRNSYTNYEQVSETTVGIPIKLKILFYTSKHFAIGVNPSANFNSIDTMYSGNIIFQYNFIK